MSSSLDSFCSRCSSSSALKPVLVRLRVHYDEEMTSLFPSKITHLFHIITWTPTAYRRNCEKLPRTKPPEYRSNSSGTRWRTCAGPLRVIILSSLLFKLFDDANLSQDTAGKVVSFYHALVYMYSFYSLTNDCFMT